MMMESNETLPMEDTDHIDNGEFECDDGSLASRLACILSYGGSLSDILINYSLVFLNAYYCRMALLASVKKYFRGPCAFELMRQRNRVAFAYGALLFVIMFQILLCLALGCSGVSIIWCAMCGWILYDRLRHVEGFEDNEVIVQRSRKAVILLDFLAIGYYGLVFSIITTIAHSAALVLGAVLSFASARMTTDFQ